MEEATGAPSSLADWDPKRQRASGRGGETVMTESPSPLTMLFSRHTKRRTFIAGLGSAAAWPVVARAQQGERVRRIGVLLLGVENDPVGKREVSAFTQGLADLGWIDGRNVRMDLRSGGADISRIPVLAQELVGLQPDIIVASGARAAVALQGETRTIPIVFAAVGDPVTNGLLPRLDRPGGNITGFALFEAALGGKWLAEIAPGLKRAALMFNPDTAIA